MAYTQAIAKVAFNDVTDVKRLAVLVKRLQESVQYFVKGTAKGFVQPGASDDDASAVAAAPVAAAASEGFDPSGLADLPPLEDSNAAFASDTDQGRFVNARLAGGLVRYIGISFACILGCVPF